MQFATAVLARAPSGNPFRRGYTFARLLARSLPLAIGLLALAPQHAQSCDAVQPVTHALRTIAAPGGGSTTRTVPVPDTLPAAVRTERHRIRYVVDVRACSQSHVAALWLFRVGAPFRILDQDGQPLQLLAGGATSMLEPLLAALRPTGETQYNGRIPGLFALPAGTREVHVELLPLPFLPAGLVRADIGPSNLLLPVQSHFLDQVIASADAASGILLVLAVLALLLWLQRRGDRALLWLAIACATWGVRGVVYFGPRVLFGALAFEQFNPFTVLIASAAVTAGVFALVGVRTRHAAVWPWGGAALGTLALLAAAVAGQGAVAARALSFSIGFLLIGSVLVIVVRMRAVLERWHVWTVGGAMVGLLLCATHDMMVVAGLLPPSEPTYVFWGFELMLVGFALMAGRYVVATLNRAERSNEELERRVVGKTGELEASYARLRESERDTARTQERERLLRDMHDGLGAQLMTVLRGVERGALAPQQVAQSLQDSLDELRLLMDSGDMGLYLPGALAAWRNRWDHRLAAAGVALKWQIDASVDDIQLPGETTMQVMRILQEAATNIVKHSQARNMVFDARVVGTSLCISIADDGVGLPAAPPRAGARGLKNMAHRAGQVGAHIEARNRDDQAGTEVVLRVPLSAAAATREPGVA